MLKIKEDKMFEMIQLYSGDNGSLVVRSTPGSRPVGLFWIEFRTASGKVARLEFLPVELTGENKLYALEGVRFEKEFQGGL